MPESPIRAKVVRVGVGEGDEPEADCELDPHAIRERETTAALRAIGRCNCHARDCISVIPPPASAKPSGAAIPSTKLENLGSGSREVVRAKGLPH
jgi:hypothetical protein